MISNIIISIGGIVLLALVGHEVWARCSRKPSTPSEDAGRPVLPIRPFVSRIVEILKAGDFRMAQRVHEGFTYRGYELAMDENLGCRISVIHHWAHTALCVLVNGESVDLSEKERCLVSREIESDIERAAEAMAKEAEAQAAAEKAARAAKLAPAIAKIEAYQPVDRRAKP